jgi:hypothetical protein
VSRKDLSRTVIEGGRYFHNKLERRASHGTARARTRAWLDRVRVDGEAADATAPRRGPRVHKMFYDKLAPAKRWLDAQVGRPWNKVFAELCARFDTRTVAGRHVVHDHMLGWVRLAGEVPRWSYVPFFVDAHGIMRRESWSRRSWSRLRAETKQWVRDRRAVLTHRGWWWFRIAPETICTSNWMCKCAHVFFGGTTLHEVRLVEDAPMTRGEMRRIDRLPPDMRAQIVLAIGAGTGLAARVK